MSIKLNGQTIAGKYKGQVIQPANETIAGIIKIATQEEVTEGTDNTSAVTPLYLASKQNKIIAGEGIEIDGDTISATPVVFRIWE